MSTERAQSEANKLIALSISVVIAVAMIGVMIPVISQNSGTVSVGNEAITSSLEFNKTYELNGYDVDSSTVTIYAENGTAGSFEEVASSQYDLNAQAGEVNFTTDDPSQPPQAGDEVNVTYDYQASSDTAGTVLDLLPLFMALIALVSLSRPIQRRL